jgi:FkbM family methyltransferase
MTGLARLFAREDFHANPLRALWRRFWWRTRWLFRKDPWPLPLQGVLTLRVPRSGTSALVFYQGYSEPETARFILGFLKPGMRFVDIGAHSGEYTLLGALAVGLTGQVHAFEPNPDLLPLLRDNVESNHLSQVTLNMKAVADEAAMLAFEVCDDPAYSALGSRSGQSVLPLPSRRVEVPALRLDDYCAERQLLPDLIKMDIEGAELLALRGAERLLTAPEKSPVLVMEISGASKARFGHDRSEIVRHLTTRGFEVWALTPEGRPRPVDEATAARAPACNVVLAKPSAGLGSWEPRP